MIKPADRTLSTILRRLCCCCLISLLLLGSVMEPVRAAENTQEETQALLKQLQKEQSEIDDTINALNGKPAQLQAFQKKLRETYKLLARQKLRLQGVQLWNGFVAFVGVAFDCIQKVNPGSSVAIATVTFLQDRATQTLSNAPLQMRLKRVATNIKGAERSLRQLDLATTMTPQEVADNLVARGMVDSEAIAVRWDGTVKLRYTPEELAKSAAVITGKTTFILERLNPAMRDIYLARQETIGSIAELTNYLEMARRKSRELEVQIAQLEGTIKLDEIRQEAYEPVLIKEQPETSLNNVPPKAPSMAFMEIQSAWNDLKSNFITGKTYQAVKRRMGYAAWGYLNQQLSAERKELQQASDYLFDELPAVLDGISDRYRRIETSNRANKRLGAAQAAFKKKQKQQLELRKKQFELPLEKHKKEVEQGEIPRFLEFCTRMKGILINNPVTHTRLRDELEIVSDTGTLNVIDSGDYMAALAWDVIAGDIKRLRFSLQITNRTERANYPSFAENTLQKAQSLLSGANSTANQMKTILGKAQDMAAELEANLNLWRYLDGLMITNTPKFVNYAAWLPHTKDGLKMFTLQAGILRARAEAEYELLKEDAARNIQSLRVPAVRKKLLGTVKSLVKTWKQAKNLTTDQSLKPRSRATSTFLHANNLTRERTEQLKKTVSDLENNPDKIENDLLRNLAGIKGAEPVPDEAQLKTLQQKYRILKETGNKSLRDYSQHYNAFQQRYSQLEGQLDSLQARYPAAAGSFSLESLLIEAGQQTAPAEWELPPPADLSISDPADDALLQDFIATATRYNQLTANSREKTEKRYTKAKNTMSLLVNKPLTTAVLQPDITPDEFVARIAALEAEAKEIYEPLAFLDDGEEKTVLGRKYKSLQDAILKAKEQYLEFWRIRVYRRLKEIEATQENSPPELKKAYQQELADFISSGSFIDQHKQKPQIADLISAIHEQLENLSAVPVATDTPVVNDQISALYDGFKQAYESKNEAQVMSYIDDDWSSADGVTLFDLEDNLRNMYNIFDDIEYRMSGLSISSAGQNLFNISYNVSIRGIIFDNDLTHEEVSAVREQIRIDRTGIPKIYKTLGGNYWSIN